MNSQFKKGALELCVLSQLKTMDRYGYQLTDAVSKQMQIAPGTLYLILKRLKEDGMLETYLVESDEGPARKYYHLTAKGKEKEEELEAEWFEFVKAVDLLLGKEN
ncbi:MAG: PadR family transcriptional regulator [Lachnospiraceae bacterium]|nr:PadR family transcriptional regulator [Lachnospiraceae bacterium]